MRMTDMIVPRAAGARGPRGFRRLMIGAAVCATTALMSAAPLRAETVPPPAATAPPAAEAPARTWSREEIDSLAGRIALYPDALVAQILPAATFPLQVVEAARWLEANKPVADGDKEPWDQSVKALLRYPTVLKMMSDDLRWTDSLGLAFMAQPEDVLQSIQRLRRQARAVGNLKDSPRQRVIVDPNQLIVIAPPAAEPDMIYVPIYDPAYVYDLPPPPGGLWVTYDAGYPLGVWIGLGVSWTSWHVVFGGWGYDWGWGAVYGGCCRGGVYRYTPTAIDRRVAIDRSLHWRPRYTTEHRRPPAARVEPRRPTAQDIARGRTPHAAPASRPGARMPDTRTTARPPAFRNVERGTSTIRNAERGRQSLGPPRAAPGAPPSTRATPPARSPAPTSRPSSRHEPGFTPRNPAPSPTFTPRAQHDTRSFTNRGNASRATMPKFEAPRRAAPERHSPPPSRSAAPGRHDSPRTAPTKSRESPRAAPPASKDGERRHR